MVSTRYLIVGGGLAGASAVEAIRARDREGRIVLVSDERHLPYDRVPLSKEYLRGELSRENLLVQTPEFYEQERVEALLGRRVEKLNLDARTALLDNDQSLRFDRLLLATGSRPRRLAIAGGDLKGIHYLRTLEDSDAIQEAMSNASRAVIVGGGFIGCEIAAACVQKGLDTTILEVGPSLLSVPLDRETAEWITSHLADHGVRILANETAARFIEMDGRACGVETKTGRRVEGDFVAVGIGVAPNVELAQESGLPIDRGVIVNDRLEVNDAGVYAAGDVARFYSPIFEKHLRLEHYDVAVKHGQLAGANMAGAKERFAELPYFFSFMFDLRTEVWGDATQRDLIIRRGPLQLTDKGGFAQFYLSGGRVQAYLSVNRPFEEAEAAKQLILRRQSIGDPSCLGNESTELGSLLN